MRGFRAPAVLIALILGAGFASARTPAACVPDASAESGRVRRYDALILRHAQRRRLNPRLVKAIIAAESQFATGAVSPSGARGLMQLMPATAREMGVPPRSLSNPDANIGAGTKYLAALFAALPERGAAPERDVRRVLAAYHSGPAALRGGGWSAATRRYVRVVMSCYQSEASALTLARNGGTYDEPDETARSIASAR
ncbi:MAG: transglycosylase SLT domain-containing protein [Elusimicrobiota bacterium]